MIRLYKAEDVAGRRLNINSVSGRLARVITLNLNQIIIRKMTSIIKHTVDHIH